MQTTNPGLIFQSDAELAAAANRQAKQKAAESIGSPISVNGKIIDLLVVDNDAYTAESSWHARRTDLRSGQTISLFKGHQGPVTSLALHAYKLATSGVITHTLVTGSWDKTIRIWDTGSGHCMHVLHGHADFIKSVTILPTIPALISTSSDKSVRLWDLRPLADGQPPTIRQTLKEHSRPVDCVAVRESSGHAEPLSIWTADSMGVIKEWRIQDELLAFVRDLSGHETSVAKLVATDEGLWSVSIDKSAIFRPFDGSSDVRFSEREYIKSIVVLPEAINNRSLVLTGSLDEDIHAWDMSGSKPALWSTIQGHCDEVTALSIWSDGTGWKVISASLDGTLRRWTPRDILSPPVLEYAKVNQEVVSLTEDEERELAELLSDDET